MRTHAGFFIILLSLTTFISHVNPIIEVAYATPDFQVKVDSFTKSTGAAPVTQNITGVGFQPKAIIFFFTRQTAQGVAVDQYFGIGFANGTNGERGVAFACDDGGGSSNCGNFKSATTMISARDQ